MVQNLLHHRGLAHLSRTRNYLDEFSWFLHPLQQDMEVPSFKHTYKLLNTLSKFTQISKKTQTRQPRLNEVGVTCVIPEGGEALHQQNTCPSLRSGFYLSLPAKSC
jgi:hypothetical protein